MHNLSQPRDSLSIRCFFVQCIIFGWCDVDFTDLYRFQVHLVSFLAKVWKWTSELCKVAQQYATIVHYCPLLFIIAQHYVIDGCTIMRNMTIVIAIPMLRIIALTNPVGAWRRFEGVEKIYLNLRVGNTALCAQINSVNACQWVRIESRDVHRQHILAQISSRRRRHRPSKLGLYFCRAQISLVAFFNFSCFKFRLQVAATTEATKDFDFSNQDTHHTTLSRRWWHGRGDETRKMMLHCAMLDSFCGAEFRTRVGSAFKLTRKSAGQNNQNKVQVTLALQNSQATVCKRSREHRGLEGLDSYCAFLPSQYRNLRIIPNNAKHCE